MFENIITTIENLVNNRIYNTPVNVIYSEMEIDVQGRNVVKYKTCFIEFRTLPVSIHIKFEKDFNAKHLPTFLNYAIKNKIFVGYFYMVVEYKENVDIYDDRYEKINDKFNPLYYDGSDLSEVYNNHKITPVKYPDDMSIALYHKIGCKINFIDCVFEDVRKPIFGYSEFFFKDKIKLISDFSDTCIFERKGI